ncbi:MAG: hypothetical protein L6435_13675 [Anaerolineae bacterium]|nr:hypothetical protein [Anaerolineae bacterium]
MNSTASMLERYHLGETIRFGTGVKLNQDGLFVGQEQIKLNTIQSLSLDESGNIVIRQLGMAEPRLVVHAITVDGVDTVLEVVNGLVREIPYTRRRSVTGWPPGSIGDVSARIGYDVRDLLITGYTDADVLEVTTGRCTLEELLERGPTPKRGWRWWRQRRR